MLISTLDSSTSNANGSVAIPSFYFLFLAFLWSPPWGWSLVVGGGAKAVIKGAAWGLRFISGAGCGGDGTLFFELISPRTAGT